MWMKPVLVLSLAVSGLTPRPPPLPAGSVLTRAAPSAQASLMVGLVLQDRAGLDALIASQHDPKSDSFRHWLTPAQFGARFGLPASRYAAIAEQFGASGMHVERYPSRLLLHATGTVGQLERLLHIDLYDVRTPTGAHFRTFRGTPRLPAAAAGLVQSLTGLDTRHRFKRRLNVGQYDAFGPQDLRRYYDVNPLHTQGFAGQLSRVGVMGPIPDDADLPDPADLNYFYANASDSPVHFNVVNLGLQGSDPDNQGDKAELEMDAEMSTVAAPLEQSVTMVLGPGDDFFVQDMAYFANTDYTVTAVSISYGDCESDEQTYAPDEMTTVTNLAAQASAEGQAWFAASGDDGADDCQTGPVRSGGDGAQVDFPGSAPYFVSVGGSSYSGNFDSNHAIASWSDEVVWNSGDGWGAGGGGTSHVFAKPSYQVGVGDSTKMRDVPDFSLLSDPNVSVAVDDTRPGLLDGSGGTSDAAPMAAGIFALINDYIGGCGIGAPQFELYRLGKAAAPVFHDITSGNLNQNGVTGAVAHAGFDDASGWGSLDIAALAQHWPACSGTGTSRTGPLYPDGGWPTNDAGFYDPGEYDGGLAPQDAGPRSAYDPCAVLACSGGASCSSIPEGPTSCDLPCGADAGASCPSGDYCDSTQARCLPGCASDADCTNNLRCASCTHECVAVRASGGAIGAPCQTDTDCTTFGTCLPPDSTYNIPDGYCSQTCDSSVPACQCPENAVCADGLGGICLASCSVIKQTGCIAGQVCNDFNRGDQGVCLPPCRDDSDCDFGTFQDSCIRDVCRSRTSTTGTSGTTGSSGGTTGGTTGGATTTTGGTTGTSGTADSGGCTSGDGGLALPLLLALGLIGVSRRREAK